MYSRNINYKHKKDNTAFYFIMLIVMSTFSSVFGIWAIVEFILYLVKDDPFNWISLWTTGFTFVATIFCLIKTFLAD